jgi:Asp-tRNA(Asn)/Glu-tRNA(Gln) amidotransferase A subunit family amidase
VGLQIVGRRFDEEMVLRVAAGLEGELGFRAAHRPPSPVAAA